jgi:hypothetical protein
VPAQLKHPAIVTQRRYHVRRQAHTGCLINEYRLVALRGRGFRHAQPQQPRLVRLPVRVQALAVPERAVPVAGLGHVPVPVAVRRVAILPETGVIVEPGRGHLLIAQRWPERLGDPVGLPGLDGIPVAVAGGHAAQDQIPLAGLWCRRKLSRTVRGQCSHWAGSWPAATSSIQVAWAPQAAHGGITTIAW